MPTNELGPGYFAIDSKGVDFKPDVQKRIREAFKRAASVPATQLKLPKQALPWTSYELVEPQDDTDR
jgi:hypothetical protein